jgi:hypothetical protein
VSDAVGHSGRCIVLQKFWRAIYFCKIVIEKIYKKIVTVGLKGKIKITASGGLTGTENLRKRPISFKILLIFLLLSFPFIFVTYKSKKTV